MRRRAKRHLIRPVIAVAVLAIAASVTAGERIVAVGDVHGSYEGLVSILQEVKLIDADTHWIGGDATFVQTGDLFDRGIRVRDVLDLLMRLQDEAAAAGGRVEVLLGNHEGMNLTGFYRDVNPKVYETFVDEKSGKRRKNGYQAFTKYWRYRADAEGVGPPHFSKEVKEQWMTAHPPGWLEYTDALGPKGKYGAWLRQRPIAIVLNGVLFIHGGLGPALAGLSIDEINKTVADELATYDRARQFMIERHLVQPTAELSALVAGYRQLDRPVPALAGLLGADTWLLRSADGPLWFRGAANWDEDTRTGEVANLLTGVGAERMVVGHSVQGGGRIATRFGERVFLIDTGMLATHYTGGRPSALVIECGVFTAVYPDGSERLEVEIEVPAAA
jgi:hypothetical protein